LFEQNQTMMFSIDNIKVYFVLYLSKRQLPFETIDAARLINLQDIIPMKLQALSNRFAKKGFLGYCLFAELLFTIRNAGNI
jgi:hypothetical protein